MSAEVTVVLLDQDCDPEEWADYADWLRQKLEDQGGIVVLDVDVQEV